MAGVTVVGSGLVSGYCGLNTSYKTAVGDWLSYEFFFFEAIVYLSQPVLNVASCLFCFAAEYITVFFLFSSFLIFLKEGTDTHP